ncbi:MAG: hypothetical protein H6708_09290 [Kofleriaceae bacterium]|nr:hypothetical protein [Kofleriaceae bacterium]
MGGRSSWVRASVIAVVVAACARPVGPTPPPRALPPPAAVAPAAPPPVTPVTPLPVTPLPPLELAATDALVTDPDLALAVDALAAARGYESAAVGIGGVESATWKLWTQVETRASADDLRALLRHVSAVVRLYVARHLAFRGAADELPALLPLLGDDTPVELLEGCSMSTQSVADALIADLCPRSAAGAAPVLLAAAAAAPPGRARPGRCPAPRPPHRRTPPRWPIGGSTPPSRASRRPRRCRRWRWRSRRRRARPR